MTGATMRRDERRSILVGFHSEAVAATLAEVVKLRAGKLRTEPFRSRVFAPIGDELLPKFSAGGTVGHVALLMCGGH